MKCFKCKKEIKELDKWVSVITQKGIKNKKIISSNDYHLDCWKIYFNECVIKKLNEEQKKAMEVIKKSPLFNLMGKLMPKGSVKFEDE